MLYVSSKFAVRGLVTALVHEVAPEIRVSRVEPGGTPGAGLRGLASPGLDDRSLGAIPGLKAQLTGAVRSRSRCPERIMPGAMRS